VPTISALKPSKAPGRVVVSVDGEFLATVGEGVVARFGLFTGRELSDLEFEELQAAVLHDKALADAYRLLAQRARAVGELRARLAQKDHPAALIDTVIARLQADGLLNDAEFARAFAADKRNLSGWGSNRIGAELRRHGVDGATIDAVLRDDTHDENGRALAALQRRGPATPPLDAARKRAYEFLLRRGYATSVAYGAVREWSRPPGELD
jgi:regulatory protein